MTILNFVNDPFIQNLPDNLTYAPEYKKGSPMKSGKPATGKNPLEDSYDRDFGPSDVIWALQRNENLQAVGIFCGIRGKGICILDVDRNLDRWLNKWGDSLSGAPCVKSTKPNAAKYIFRVPEALWGVVTGHGLREEEGGDYEILWGKRQGVIYGAYPGGHSSREGQYQFEGDLHSIPIAPDWLLAEMKAKPTQRHTKKDLDFSDRTEDEIAQIIHDCLSVISQKGLGSRDEWIKVGMAINSALPNDLGLALWVQWSQEDPDYASEWENTDYKENPCTKAWYTFKDGGIGLGTLIWLADCEDPKRHRFSKEIAEIVQKAEDHRVQEIRTTTLDFNEVIKRAKTILELDNPAELNYKLNSLALQAGYRDQSSLEKIIVDQLQFENQKGIMSVADLMKLDTHKEYLIPDILPNPSVVLIYGSGGDGKSMSAWTLAKHVATGRPFLVRGNLVPVKKGPVLILNGDQPLGQIAEQLEEVDYPVDDSTRILTDWQLQRYAQFAKLMNDLQPKLVVIDSLIGCSGGRAFDENKSEFAQPLYWLTRNNGVLFPRSTILVIHHANKNGGFRGTSSIRDAVDETWALTKPSEDQLAKLGEKGRYSRLIEIEKSRSGRMGTKLVMQMQDDLSFTIEDYTPAADITNTNPASVSDRVLQRLRVVAPESRSTTELIVDPLLDGKPAAIRKSLQRLLKRGLIKISNEEINLPKGNTPQRYTAVLARGEVSENVPSGVYPSDGTESDMGHLPETKEECPTASNVRSHLGQG